MLNSEQRACRFVPTYVVCTEDHECALCDVKRDIGKNFTHRSTSSKFQKIVVVIKETFQESRDHW